MQTGKRSLLLALPLVDRVKCNCEHFHTHISNHCDAHAWGHPHLHPPHLIQSILSSLSPSIHNQVSIPDTPSSCRFSKTLIFALNAPPSSLASGSLCTFGSPRGSGPRNISPSLNTNTPLILYYIPFLPADIADHFTKLQAFLHCRSSLHTAYLCLTRHHPVLNTVTTRQRVHPGSQHQRSIPILSVSLSSLHDQGDQSIN